MWTLNEGVDFVRRVETALSPAGYHVALGGGVLHKGGSTHDLDVVVFPHNLHTSRARVIEQALQRLGMRRTATCMDMHQRWAARAGGHAAKGMVDAKHVEQWQTEDGRRVDIILMRA